MTEGAKHAKDRKGGKGRGGKGWKDAWEGTPALVDAAERGDYAAICRQLKDVGVLGKHSAGWDKVHDKATIHAGAGRLKANALAHTVARAVCMTGRGVGWGGRWISANFEKLVLGCIEADSCR